MAKRTGLPSPSQFPLLVEALLQVKEAKEALRMLVPNHEGRAEKTRGFHPFPSASATQTEGVTPEEVEQGFCPGDGHAIKQELSGSA